MKSAKLEMKGIRCLEWANVPGLCYPLFAVIQLNGYSLIAQSVVILILLFFIKKKIVFSLSYKRVVIAAYLERNTRVWKCRWWCDIQVFGSPCSQHGTQTWREVELNEGICSWLFRTNSWPLWPCRYRYACHFMKTRIPSSYIQTILLWPNDSFFRNSSRPRRALLRNRRRKVDASRVKRQVLAPASISPDFIDAFA